MVEGVFFDLDGTLADTAPDLAAAINQVRQDHDLPALELAELRPFVSSGARGMLRAAFGLKPEDDAYPALAERFLGYYAGALCKHTRLFEGMPAVLDALDAARIPWGIVTNKHSRLAKPLVAALQLEARACCIIGGDSAARPKPAPDPLLLGCEQAGVDPRRCVYVGDDLRDIVAGRGAQMRTIAVSYGYLGIDEPITAWGADMVIDHPEELLHIIGLENSVRDSMQT